MDAKLSTTPEELFALIGEREFIKFKQGQEIQKLYMQIDEMAQTITELRKRVVELEGHIGRLEQPDNNDAV